MAKSHRLASRVQFSSWRLQPRQALCPLIWLKPECYKYACIKLSLVCLRASVWNVKMGASNCEVPKSSFTLHFFLAGWLMLFYGRQQCLSLDHSYMHNGSIRQGGDARQRILSLSWRPGSQVKDKGTPSKHQKPK